MPVRGFFTKDRKKRPITSRRSSSGNSRNENARRKKMLNSRSTDPKVVQKILDQIFSKKFKATAYGINIVLHEDDEGDFYYTLRDKSGNWFKVSENDEDNLAFLAKNFKSQWRGRVGQDLEG